MIRPLVKAILISLGSATLVIVAVILAFEAFGSYQQSALQLLDAKRPYAPEVDFLPEGEAMAIARSAMKTAGYPTDQWLSCPEDSSKVPHGRADETAP